MPLEVLEGLASDGYTAKGTDTLHYGTEFQFQQGFQFVHPQLVDASLNVSRYQILHELALGIR